MINKDNFKELLLALGFEGKDSILEKKFKDIDAVLKADFKKKELIYPENKGLKINSRDTCNFRANENFVVFECVNQLFEKGYKPEHLELEPKWQVGHGTSGGRADILVRDNSENSLLIIECKTAGKEFENAWKYTNNRPTQLFSYAQQEKSTDFITLYTSDFIDGKPVNKYYLIALKDNEELLKEIEDKEPLSYKSANSVEEIWNTWDQTYQKGYSTQGILEDSILPYHIGKKNYSVEDLEEVNHRDRQGKYHEFATILRQHNVSGRENAFDKLVNLFLCKIVDETQNPEDLKFYWKGTAYDNDFDLQDRLQSLYQAGMKEFLGESVTYINKEQVNDAFRFFENDPDATRDTINKYFRDLKFFTNNDFAFIDVHNERLFNQNAKVLLKIVQMLQDIRLKTDEQNQFLGDMFEGFLDQGVKQSEGQFFTPMPIVKFMLHSLPLEQMVNNEDEIPKVIDYACGAGHFLNEYAKQLLPIVEEDTETDINDYYPHITGIEKEYRLSKVAKVSSFMYGQDDINIIHGDALSSLPNIKNGAFSLLISNPPYSVKGYLETIKEIDRKKYSLLQAVSEKSYPTNNSIETFFIERAKQLLKPGGIAAIIVPSSTLTKGNDRSTSDSLNIYVATRQILLKYFDILAIVEPGSGTFGKTGTNTVILFLRRRTKAPAPAEHYSNRMNDWFNGKTNKDVIFKDHNLIKQYCRHVDLNFDDYESLLKGSLNEDLRNTDIFKEYRADFDKWSKIKNRKKQATFKSLSKKKQKEELEAKFLTFVRNIEKEKLYYFVMASLNEQEVIIARSPSGTSKNKKFLGYEWSSAKGNEGIKYLGGSQASVKNGDDDALEEGDKRVLENIQNLGNILTPLYDPENPGNPEKINHLIASNFKGEDIEIPENLQKYVTTARLTDMLDFERKDFDKAIDLNPTRKIEIKTKWDYDRLGNISEIIKGTSITKNQTTPGDIPVVAGGKNYAYLHNQSNRKPNCITVSASGANAGFINFWAKEIFASDCSTVKTKTVDETKYIYYILKSIQEEIFLLAKGAAQPHVYPDDLEQIKIPLPPKKIQNKIVKACEALDKKFEKAQQTIEKANKGIEEKVNGVYGNGFASEKISNLFAINSDSIDPSGTPQNKFTYIDINSVEKGTGKINTDQIIKGINAPSRAKRKAKNGEFIISSVRPYLKGFAYIKNVEKNWVFSTGFFILDSKNDQTILNKFGYNLFMYSSDLMNQMKSKMPKGSYPSINKSDLQNFVVPVPEKKVQQDLIKEIGILKETIAKAQAIIDNTAEEKQKMIQKYL